MSVRAFLPFLVGAERAFVADVGRRGTKFAIRFNRKHDDIPGRVIGDEYVFSPAIKREVAGVFA
jgi:hypothetical protein